MFTLRRFSYRYPETEAWALDSVNLDLAAGLHLVAGASGSGKSTLLRVCNGLVPHFHGGTVSGFARVGGHDILTTPTRELARNAGFLFQDSEMQSVYATVERDVAFGLENLGVPRAQMIDRVDESLCRLGIAALRSRPVATLSGGERQRLALAGVLAMRPSLLALDEPLAQLDPGSVEPFIAFLSELALQGTSVIVAEHRMDHLLGAANSLTLVAGGRVDGPAPPAQLVEKLSHPPDVVLLGRRLGWQPPALDVSSARARITPMASSNGISAAATGAVAWRVSGATLAAGGEPVLGDVHAYGREGEVTVLMGKNGGGKTTLLRAVAGLLAPRVGSIERTPGRVAYLPQNPTALLHRASVRAEVELTLHRAREPESADVVLALLGLSHVAGRYPRDLSTGERQRAALAAVLAGTPRIALLDEPTRGMDGPARAALVKVVRNLAARGTSIAIATHDSELAASVGDRILQVGDGTVQDRGSPAVALRGDTPYATQIGRLFRDGPVTLEAALALL